MTVRRLAARDLEQVVRTNLERLEPLLFRTQLPGYEGERSGPKHWTGVTQGTARSRADTTGSGRRTCEPEFNYQDAFNLIQKQKIKPTQKGEKQNEH